jgi:hypothetical protein
MDISSDYTRTGISTVGNQPSPYSVAFSNGNGQTVATIDKDGVLHVPKIEGDGAADFLFALSLIGITLTGITVSSPSD